MKAENIKAPVAALLLLGLIQCAMAIMSVSFSSWEGLAKNSPDIVVAYCNKTPTSMNVNAHTHTVDTQGWINSNIEIVSILKGTTNWGTASLEAPKLGAAQLGSEYCPRQGEYYLIFSIYHDGFYQATEDYRIVPLGLNFSTNSLSGKTLDEQIQMLLQRRLDDLNRQMKGEQEEKQRLEEGIKK